MPCRPGRCSWSISRTARASSRPRASAPEKGPFSYVNWRSRSAPRPVQQIGETLEAASSGELGFMQSHDAGRDRFGV